MENLAWVLLAAIASGFGGYFGAYLRKRGENLATKEDFRDLKEQTAELTRTTKEIETKIDDQIWRRQRQWELRRDVLLEASRRVAEADNALLSLNSAVSCPHSEDDPHWVEAIVERQHSWGKASSALDESRFAIGVVCGKATIDAVDSFAVLANNIAAELSRKKPGAYQDRALELTEKFFVARHAIRKELGVESLLTPRSSGPSAPQDPAA
jgi:hypothetical protein